MAVKGKYVLLLLVVILCLTGCKRSGRTSEAKPYSIYYKNLNGTKLEEKKYTPVSTRFEGILEELLDQFQYSGYSDVNSAMPPEVKMNGYTMGVDDLQIDFDANYLSLSNVQEVLLRAGLVKTLVQLPGVLRVRITVDGQPLTDNDGKEISMMNENTFIDSQDGGINSYHYVTLNLYFASHSGNKIVKEMRNVYYSSNLIMEKVIVEQIISGPVNEKLLPVVAPDVLVRSVQISRDICNIDLDDRFNSEPTDEEVEPEVCLYAFVDAICDACDVKGVRFRINGESDIRFRGQVNLNQVFERNVDVIEASELSEPLTEIILDDTGSEAIDNSGQDTAGSSSGGASGSGNGEADSSSDGVADSNFAADGDNSKTDGSNFTVADSSNSTAADGSSSTAVDGGNSTAADGSNSAAADSSSSAIHEQNIGVGIDPALVEDNP